MCTLLLNTLNPLDTRILCISLALDRSTKLATCTTQACCGCISRIRSWVIGIRSTAPVCEVTTPFTVLPDICAPGTTVHPPRMTPTTIVAILRALPEALNVAHIPVRPNGLSRALQIIFAKGLRQIVPINTVNSPFEVFCRRERKPRRIADGI